MILETIEPRNYGPFAVPKTVRLEPDVTVLTGPNDTGKTSFLRLIARLCRASGWGPLGEEEFNQDSLHDKPEPWTKRTDFGAIVTLRLGETRPKGLPGLHKNARSVVVECNLAPDVAQAFILKQFDDKQQSILEGRWAMECIPTRVVSLPPSSEVRDTIDCVKPTDVELKLLKVALGGEFKFEQLTILSPRSFEGQLARAEQTLNRHLNNFLPPSLGLAWSLRGAPDRKSIHCFLQDKKGGLTTLGSRGAGVRRVMAVLAWLMSHEYGETPSIVIFDEPETSLHADSQHLLRKVLETLGAKSSVQVVYSTHSPSMVNVMRPHAIRLFKRITLNNRASTTIENRPFAENYLPVRTNLGLTPADSLLYAPVSVVVEGDTEVVGLQLLLLKLAEKRVLGFESVPDLLSQTHFLDGMGDSYPFVCRMAKSQGAKPIIFLDGDKARHVAQQKLSESHPDVPVITLPGGLEFEQLVPPTVYFQALASVIEGTSGEITQEQYDEWEQGARLPAQLMFSKRVDRWLASMKITEWSKTQVMRRAVELVDVADVNTEPLLKLVACLEQKLSSC